MRIDENVISSVQDRYPILISLALKKFKEKQYEEASDQLVQLVELWEVILRYLASIICRTYLVSESKSETINNIIREFRQPSDGHWVQLLRECSAQYRGEGRIDINEVDSSPVVLSQKIADFYFSKLPEGRNNKIYKYAQELIDLNNDFKINLMPRNDSLFNLILNIRNWMAHTARRTEKEYASVVELLNPIIMHILNDLDFLAQYMLYYVKEVKVEKGAFNHIVHICMGRGLELKKIEVKEKPLNNGELYLFEINTLESGDSEINWALSLSPYLIVEQCQECQQQQIFIFNEFDKRKIVFVSFQCGHRYMPPEMKRDLEDIFDFLEGKISVGELLKGKAIGKFFTHDENLSVSPEAKIKSKTKMEEGRQSVEESEFALALKSYQEAIELDNDNAEAYFLSAMCRILTMDEIQSILREAKKALELAPENPKYSLTIARLYYEIGMFDDALQYFHRTTEIDPSNQQARDFLDEIGKTIEIDNTGGCDERS